MGIMAAYKKEVGDEVVLSAVSNTRTEYDFDLARQDELGKALDKQFGDQLIPFQEANCVFAAINPKGSSPKGNIKLYHTGAVVMTGFVKSLEFNF
jgi:hypothetical protein